MVSQFVSSHQVNLLGGIDFNFPAGTHAIGRLDKDSEGLLILTTDKTVTRKLFLATRPHTRTYLVMVQNVMTAETFCALQNGVNIKIKNNENYVAKPFNVKMISRPAGLYSFATDRREIYPHTWLAITLTEGKYHQVRKMVLATRHRCLRLIRLSIGNILLENLAPGSVMEMGEADFFERLKQSDNILVN